MYKIIETKCEYGENPVGLDCENPRLFWKLSSDGADQKFYRVIESLHGIPREKAPFAAKMFLAGMERFGNGTRRKRNKRL